MPSMLRGPVIAGLVTILMSCCASVAFASPGSVRIVRTAAPSAATLAEQAFLHGRVWRTRTTGAPLSWSANTWAHRHAFALEPADAAAHPAWGLLDAYGAPLYIGDRVAADFGNASFRSWWIARAQAALAAGHRGLFIDDVLMERRTTTAWGTSRMPIDPRTGATMTEANWQRYMADFMVAVRAALPGTEIAHDVLWFKGDGGPNVLRGLQAATHLWLDRAFNDTVVSSGGGTYGWQTLAGWIERAQTRGLPVILDGPTTTPAARLYGLASYLLVSDGASAIANDDSTASGAFWAGYDLDLGMPAGARYSVATGAWRRDFARGIVLVNEPFRNTRTISVPSGYADLDGVARSSVTLAGGTGVVLVPAPPAPVPTPTPPPVAPVPPVAPPKPVAPVPVAPVPVAPAPTVDPGPAKSQSAPGGRARIARVGHSAGARAPGATSTSVRGSRRLVSGRVQGAVSGYVRITVERKRGSRWTLARRAKVAVTRSGAFVKDIPRLPAGTYRVRGVYEGTGTMLPSRSGYRTFR